MTQLSPQHRDMLLALFRAAKGEAGRFVLAATEEAALLEELLHAKLLELEIEEADSSENWYAALTEAGREIADAAHREEHTVYAQLSFDTTEPEQAQLVQQLAELANGETGALLGHLFALHEALERGDIDALMNAYPETRATVQQMIRASVDSQMMAQEQHRINHLLGEISELKTMLTKQADYQQATPPKLAPRQKIDDDEAPIPAPKPVVMRPVMPHTPQGQPKQLTVPQFALPHDDEESEDLIVVKKDAEAGKRASENFIQSLERLQK
jgi:hypothetical protein